MLFHPNTILYNIVMFILLYECTTKLACATVSKVYVQINKISNKYSFKICP